MRKPWGESSEPLDTGLRPLPKPATPTEPAGVLSAEEMRFFAEIGSRLAEEAVPRAPQAQPNAAAPKPFPQRRAPELPAEVLRGETMPIEAVYEAAGIPDVRYPAENAIAFLSELPPSLSQETRFQKVQATLLQVEPDDRAVTAMVLGDAAEKLVALRKYLAGVENLYLRNQEHDAWRIQVLEEEVARMRAELDGREREYQVQRQELLTRLDELTGVIVFFDAFQGYLSRLQGEPEPEVDEVPAFLRDDAIWTLLEAQHQHAAAPSEEAADDESKPARGRRKAA